MFDQTFSLVDLPRLLTLIFLEGILSVDNALAIALIVRTLPNEKRKKALFVGLVSAIVFRAIGVLSAAYLIQLFWVQFLGGMYLIYLSSKHLWRQGHPETPSTRKKKRSFWMTVVMIEFTDFVFAIDSILAGLALIGVAFHPPKLPPKLWIVYVGGISGLILMRFAARLFTDLIERFPRLEIGAHLIVGWIGIKLLLEASLKSYFKTDYSGLPLWSEVLFWVGIVGFFVLGFYSKKKQQ